MWEILGITLLIIGGCFLTILVYYSTLVYLPEFIRWLQLA